MTSSDYRIIAIDYGRARIGIATSSPFGGIALPLPTVAVAKMSLEEATEEVARAVKDLRIRFLLVGLPLELRGTEGPMAQEARLFGEALSKKLTVPVQYYDERFTSKIADRSLRQFGLKRRERDRRSDSSSACQLLQEYLDSNPPTPA